MFKKFSLCFSVALIFSLSVYVYGEPIFKGYSDSFSVCFYSASSSGTIKEIDGKDIPVFGKYGESFCKNNNEISVTEVFERFAAEVIFTEKIAEGVSYYAYSENIPYGKLIKGRKVNLHIFVGKEKTTVGSPIIFGSF